MSGFLGEYEDSSNDDDDAPSILTKAAQEAAAATALANAPGAAGGVLEAGTAAGAGGTDPALPPGAMPAAARPEVPKAASAAAMAARASPLVGASSPSLDGSGRDDDEPLSPADGEEDPLMPPSPPGEPDEEILERVRSLHDLMKRGRSIRAHIQGSRDWSNPYILERVIKVFEIDEHGSNYPKQTFDPARIVEHPSDYFDAPECERPPLPKRFKRNERNGKEGQHHTLLPPPSLGVAGAE